MRLLWTGILVTIKTLLLLPKTESFRQIKRVDTRNKVAHAGGTRQNLQNADYASDISESNIVGAKSRVCLSASLHDKIDTKPDAEKIGSTVIRSLRKLCGSGSDIRGRFVDHDDTIHSLVAAIEESETISNQPSLTPFAAYCIGFSYANAVVESLSNSSHLTICIGVDPRKHGTRLAEAFGCGVRAYSKADSRNRCSIKLVFTGIATTPACASFVRSQHCDGAVVR